MQAKQYFTLEFVGGSFAYPSGAPCFVVRVSCFATSFVVRRVSRRTGESVSIENQKEVLTRYVKEQGWTLYSIYCDDGVSGTTFDRSGFQKLMEDATAGRIKAV